MLGFGTSELDGCGSFQLKGAERLPHDRYVGIDAGPVLDSDHSLIDENRQAVHHAATTCFRIANPMWGRNESASTSSRSSRAVRNNQCAG